jgi:hypothetical protein
MGKLAIIGASLFAFHVGPAVTRAEAVRAIRSVPAHTFYGQQVTSCSPEGLSMSCEVQAGSCYDDPTFGPSLMVATTVVSVSRVRRGYRVRIVEPDHFAAYAGDCVS